MELDMMIYSGKGDRFIIFSDGDYGLKVDEAANDWFSCHGNDVEVQDYYFYETESHEYGVRRHLVVRYRHVDSNKVETPKTPIPKNFWNEIAPITTPV